MTQYLHFPIDFHSHSLWFQHESLLGNQYDNHFCCCCWELVRDWKKRESETIDFIIWIFFWTWNNNNTNHNVFHHSYNYEFLLAVDYYYFDFVICFTSSLEIIKKSTYSLCGFMLSFCCSLLILCCCFNKRK